ncbi:MAG: conjugal transfer protein TraX [Roseburia sp.]|nr:conjugal transfer protein TraX [Roseburia sp.]
MNLGNVWTKEIPEEKKGLSGSTIKLIAVITMIIDHIGAAVLGRYLTQTGIGNIMQSGSQEALAAWMREFYGLYATYEVMRYIGRVAFPIYCFLLVEGFFRSRDLRKYSLRLFLFAVISEIPFDLAFNGKVWYSGYQNVFFELFVGLLTIMGICAVGERIRSRFLNVLACIGITAAAAMLAEGMALDYGAIGIVCIVLLYSSASNKRRQIIVGALSFCWELTAPLAFIPISFYNGKRGLSLKYFFYMIYPIHLLLLYFICLCLGIAGYSAL